MLGESRIGALIQLTTAAKFLSLRSPLAISVLGDSPSVEIQARAELRRAWILGALSCPRTMAGET